ncbi:hypothetical protein KY290_003374 [Solanum tuberosum]|uniref:F-box domain-containing protein n=1 Tax=Solanum tuberosum TaxID=4113 RepID=A0ABQ7WSR3_SOLTU|nr:hypothetical protein KY290_003374 [Solanum tuberosum]
MEPSEDTIIDILHRLPSKSLARFKCVSRSWRQHVSDSRSQRQLCTRTIGLFYQPIGTQSPIHFFFTSSEKKNMVKENFDESVNFLPDHSLYIIASSMGFLLCCEEEIYQQHYYVYNPATRQSIALPQAPSCSKHVAIGFNCKLDDPINSDIVSFTIVRYEIPVESMVTIESFRRNVWVKINLALEIPRIDFHTSVHHPSNWLKSGGSIDGVFYWLDFGPRINVYDSVNTCFWCIDVPDGLDYQHKRCLGVSRGVLCYGGTSPGLMNFGDMSVWHLKSGVREKTAIWEQYTTLSVCIQVFTCLSNSGLLKSGRIQSNRDMTFHPAEPLILIVLNNKKGGAEVLMSYDMDKSSSKLVCDFGNGNSKTHTNLVPYEWHEWPLFI